MSFRTLSSTRWARPLIVGAVAVAAAGGGTAVAYSAGAKTVQLSVDGASRSLSLRGGTVGDVLTKAQVAVGSHDLLAPSASTPVRDGSRIVLTHGREMVVTVDGVPRTVWVTATSVGEALSQIDPSLGSALLSADRSREIPLRGFSLDVRTRKTVTLIADGKRRAVATNGLLVSDVLSAAHVVLRPADRISVPVRTRIASGGVVTVRRIDVRMTSRETAIAFATVRRPDATLTSGATRVAQVGHAGVRRTTYRSYLLDGKAFTVRPWHATVRLAPVNQVISVGTKPVPAPAPAPVIRRTAPRRAAAPAPAPTSSGGLNWGALANCESGGNPRAVSSSGTYRGLYQFSLSTWHSVGGSGDPIDASGAEQTHRAQILYNQSGRGSWPVCGRYL